MKKKKPKSAKQRLNLAQEHQFLTTANGGGEAGKAAAAILAEAYRPLVISIAKTAHRKARAVPLDDLIQEGFVGLLEAIKKYDPAKRTSLASYAPVYVMNRVYDCIEADVRQRAPEVDAPAHETYVPPALEETVEPDAERVVYADEVVPLVSAFVAKLPAKERRLVERMYWGTATKAEVAREMGVDPSTVTKMHDRVMARGREALAEAV